MKNYLLLLSNFFFLLSFSQQNSVDMDKTSIKSMCGCFDVKFNFAETFSYSKDSSYQPSKVKIAGALDWAQFVEEDNNKVVIQHLLVVGSESNPMVIKHWRQDWKYQDKAANEYVGQDTWLQKKSLGTKERALGHKQFFRLMILQGMRVMGSGNIQIIHLLG